MWAVRADRLLPGMVLADGGEVLSVEQYYYSPDKGYLALVAVKGDLFAFDLNRPVEVVSLGPYVRETYLMRREGVLEDAEWYYLSGGEVVRRAYRGKMYVEWLESTMA